MAEPVKKSSKKSYDPDRLTGREKAAILMLSMPTEQVTKIFAELDELEVMELTQAMVELGNVPATTVEKILLEFAERSGSTTNVKGSLTSTEMLLAKIFPPDKVAQIMSEIRGPAGRTMWDKLNNVDEKSLAGFLKNEHPQTVAVIMTRLKADHTAKIFQMLPEDFAMDVMARQIRMSNVQRDVLQNIEETLRSEFISNFARSQQKDPHEMLAEIFNYFDRTTEARFMENMEKINPESAERIRSLMFTFVDMVKLNPAGIQTVLRVADKTKLALALKGASEEIKEMFFNNMSERAGKLLKEDMESLGMVRLKDVDEAQMTIVAQTKILIDKGEVVLQLGEEDEQLIG